MERTFIKGYNMQAYRHVIEIGILIFVSYIGYLILKRMFRAYKADFLRAGFSGTDLNKPYKPLLPEAQGVLAGAVFLLIMFVYIPVPFWRYLFGQDAFFPSPNFNRSLVTDEERSLMFKSQFINYLAGLLCICCMIFLGFADDALNLPWRHKLILPAVATLPLLVVYFANDGTTVIVVPVFLRSLFGRVVDIGFLYYIYMEVLAVFCTNAINIYAGINGLEVGQSLVIALSIILFNLLELHGLLWYSHLLSLYFLIPFVAVCRALYKFNRYPASVFVGDTLCYFAGMTFAVVGILGHFSKTLMLFFAPQLINFVISLPQIYAFIPCPRHRMPSYNSIDGLLHPSVVRFHPKSICRLGELVLRFSSRVGLVSCTTCVAYQPPPSGPILNEGHSQDDALSCPSGDGNPSDVNTSKPPKDQEEEIVEVTNFTLINVVLRICGPMTEKATTDKLLWLQVICSCLAFIIRYPFAWIFYDTPTG